MIYEVRLGGGGTFKLIQTKNISYEEAEKIAKEMVEEAETNREPIKYEINISVQNDILEGKTYLIRNKGRQLPAVCTSTYSYRSRWSRNKARRFNHYKVYEHRFKYLHSGKTFTLKCQPSSSPLRLGACLCENTELGKPECVSCEARFYCYTTRESK